MRSSYKSLLRIRLRHAYFSDGQCTSDCAMEPSPGTRSLLQALGLGLRSLPDGCAIFAEVEPGTVPPKLWRPLGDEPLKFVLLIQPRSPMLEQITALPAHRPAATVFHMANLFQSEVDGRLLLTDPIAHRSIGDPLALVTSPTYTYRVAAPQPDLALTATDLFGKQTPITLPDDTDDLTDFRIDLSAIEGVTSGTYILADNAGGSVRIYYDPTLAGKAPLAIAEVFSSTAALTPGGNNLVPEDYRFLSAGVVHPQDYFVQFESLATIWRYNVSKRDDKNQIHLAELSIAGPVAFTRALEQNRAVFTSNTAIPLAERPYTVELKRNGNRVQRLPNPNIAASLKKDEGAGGIVSEVNVYV